MISWHVYIMAESDDIDVTGTDTDTVDIEGDDDGRINADIRPDASHTLKCLQADYNQCESNIMPRLPSSITETHRLVPVSSSLHAESFILVENTPAQVVFCPPNLTIDVPETILPPVHSNNQTALGKQQQSSIVSSSTSAAHSHPLSVSFCMLYICRLNFKYKLSING